MKKVKYVWGDFPGIGLTTGKVYDVIDYNIYSNPNNDTVEILNDFGEEQDHYMRNDTAVYFVDFTTEYRSEIIDNILA